jgi:hypothetical protein
MIRAETPRAMSQILNCRCCFDLPNATCFPTIMPPYESGAHVRESQGGTNQTDQLSVSVCYPITAGYELWR